jgi:hypothetical protein
LVEAVLMGFERDRHRALEAPVAEELPVVGVSQFATASVPPNCDDSSTGRSKRVRFKTTQGASTSAVAAVAAPIQRTRSRRSITPVRRARGATSSGSSSTSSDRDSAASPAIAPIAAIAGATLASFGIVSRYLLTDGTGYSAGK